MNFKIYRPICFKNSLSTLYEEMGVTPPALSTLRPTTVTIFRKNINDICIICVQKHLELFEKRLQCCGNTCTITLVIGSKECCIFGRDSPIALCVLIFERTARCSPHVAWNVYPVLFSATVWPISILEFGPSLKITKSELPKIPLSRGICGWYCPISQ